MNTPKHNGITIRHKQALEKMETTAQAFDYLYRCARQSLEEIECLSMVQERFNLTDRATFNAYEKWQDQQEQTE